MLRKSTLRHLKEKRGGRGWAKFAWMRPRLVASVLLAVVCAAPAFVNSRAQQVSPSKRQGDARAERDRYKISLNLDFDARTYTGTERVRWTNRGDNAASALYFHLYPNMRAEDDRANSPGSADASAPNEPRLEGSEVRAASQALAATAEDEGATLRVQF